MAVLLEREMLKLKKGILEVGALVENAVCKATASLEKRDPVLAEAVLTEDATIDELEVELEEECLKALALYQPVAHDLRFVIALLKINNDLERIGDLAVNIAERSKHLSTREKIRINFDFIGMAEKAQNMLRKSLDALVNLDLDLANQVRGSDDEIDSLNRKVYGIVQDCIRTDVNQLETYIQYIAVSRALERIADHATNIAEDVLYLVQGQIVRHKAV